MDYSIDYSISMIDLWMVLPFDEWTHGHTLVVVESLPRLKKANRG